MSTIKKLMLKACSSPSNITFNELCLLFEHCGFVCRAGKGSHRVYKRNIDPKATYAIQEGNGGKAQSYQVIFLTEWVATNFPDEGINEK
jgi:hypothetical protein